MADLILLSKKDQYYQITYNVHMKSEFYREVSHENRPQKSTTKNKPKKQTQPITHINPIRMSKALKSQTRSLIKSIDPNQKMKQSTQGRIMRMSFSKPAVQFQDDIDVPHINEKSIVSVCCKCQTLKQEHQRQIKALKMHYQEQQTANNQKFIQMEKKYLLKESQYITLQNIYRNVLKSNQEMKGIIEEKRRQIYELNNRLDQSDEEILKLFQELKKYQQQNKFFNHFLTAFVEQTKSMVQWCQLFDHSYQQLPNSIKTVRKELMNRRTDLDVILKESVNYQTHNFGPISVRQSQNSSFCESQENGTQSFMKYFKQNNTIIKQNNTISTKQKFSREIPFTEIKERSHFSEAFTINKENIDTSNKHSFQDLIFSRIQQQRERKRAENINDQMFRMLLTQAQTIESSQYSRNLGNSKSLFSVDGSLLSSISKNIDHFVQ